MRFYTSQNRVNSLKHEARKWLGAPFFLNGVSMEGVGCAGLQLMLHKSTGAVPLDMQIPMSSTRYSGQKDLRTMGKWLEKYPDTFKKIKKSEMLPGDLFTFVFQGTTREFHIASYLGDWGPRRKVFIHACPHFGVSLADLFDCTYSTTVLDAWTIVE